MKIRTRTIWETHGGQVLALSLASGSVVTGFGIFSPFLPIYAEILGAEFGLQIGIIASSFTITRLLLSLPMGSYSDRIGRRGFIVLGLLVYAVATLAFFWAPSWEQLALYRSLQGIGAGMFWPAAMAHIGDTVPLGSRSKAMGYFFGSATLGMVVGPALGGSIQFYSEKVLKLPLEMSLRLPFLAAAGFGLLSTFLAWWLVKPARAPYYSPRNEDGRLLFKPARKVVLGLVALSWAQGYSFSFLQPVVVFFTEHQLGLPKSDTSVAMATAFFLAGTSSALVQFLAGRLADKVDRRLLLMVGGSSAQLLTFLLPISLGVRDLILLLVLRAALTALYLPAISSLPMDIMPNRRRGSVAGLLEMATSAGSVAGPLISFLAYDLVSPAAPFQLAALLFLAALLLFLLSWRRPASLILSPRSCEGY